ncbi:MAG: septal ring lytic transglycosylase RlpA family protein [Rhodospirillales bacterium]|nr:septal ring lytic transglycosylase RlpA family protein [Rhodospirillales bacterium]
MSLYSRFGRLSVLVIAGAMLMACTETQFVMHTAKRLGDTNKSQGTYKVGNPYEVKGIWYTPAEDWEYDQTGIASWYGPQFHGKATANGEVFDEWSVSAAHKTLPMPSMVRVTNLENGRSLVVRVNDRGPFASSRIIDMSHRAAQLLGFDLQGTARVRVQVMAEESRILAQRAKGERVQLASNEAPIQSDGISSSSVATQELAPLEEAPSSPVETMAMNEAPASNPASNPSASNPRTQVGYLAQYPVSPTRMYVQAGAFSDKLNAEKVKSRLSSIGDVTVTPVPVNGRELFRVRLGPVEDVADADRLLNQVVEAGYDTARTVVETAEVN